MFGSRFTFEFMISQRCFLPRERMRGDWLPNKSYRARVLLGPARSHQV